MQIFSRKVFIFTIALLGIINVTLSTYAFGPSSIPPGGGGLISISNTGVLQITAPQALTINPNGNLILSPTTGFVGIGIAAPTNALDVNGNIRATGAIYSSSFQGEMSAGNIRGTAAFGNNLGGITNYAFPGALAIGTSTTVGLPTSGLYVKGETYFNGPVNIGLPNDNSHKFRLDGGFYIQDRGAFINLESLSLDNSEIDIASNLIVIGNQVGGYGNEPLLTLDSTFQKSSSSLFSFMNGNVGIGTTTPAYNLDVIGGQRIVQQAPSSYALYVSGGKNFIQNYLGVGPGASSPQFQLDLDGAMRIRPSIQPSVPQNGVIYYNSTEKKFKCYEDNAWKNCISSENSNALAGSGTVNYVPLWTGGTTLGNSEIYTNNGNVGIDTTNSEFKLNLDNDGGIIAKGIFGLGASLTTEGGGSRMMWYPKKGAFRAGVVDGTNFATRWDEANIGNYSFAAGHNTLANGLNSTALGRETVASGNYSFAAGLRTTASGNNAIAFGNAGSAGGLSSFSAGEGAHASGFSSIALGSGVQAYGDHSFAIGSYAQGQGIGSIAIGRKIQVGGNYSVGINLSDVYNSNFDTPNTFAIFGGNVGIGTGSPAHALHVATPASNNAEINIQTGANNYWALYHDNLSEDLRVWNNDAIGDKNVLTFKNNGRVGIGTTNPSQALEVNGYIKGTAGICIGNDCKTEWPAGGAGGGDGIQGNGTAQQFAFFSDNKTLTSGPQLSFDQINNTLMINGPVQIGGGAFIRQVEAGTKTLGAGNNGETVTVQFRNPFIGGVIPKVIVTPKNNTGNYLGVFSVVTENVSDKSFEVRIYRVDAGSWDAGLNLDWFAWWDADPGTNKSKQ